MRSLLLILLMAGLSSPLFAQRWAVGTNALDYLNLGTLNAEASYALARHWSVSAAVKYNPFTYGGARYRQRSASVSAKYWFWHIYSGWWLNGRLRCQEYNQGGFRGPETREGNRLGAGLSAGYSYILSPRLNLDLSLGFWAGRNHYRIYECQSCGLTLSRGTGPFLLPCDVAVSLSYVL